MLLDLVDNFWVAAGGSGSSRSGTIRGGGAYDGSNVITGGPYGGAGKGIASDGSGGLTAGSAFANTGSGGGGNGNDNGNGEPGWGWIWWFWSRPYRIRFRLNKHKQLVKIKDNHFCTIRFKQCGN